MGGVRWDHKPGAGAEMAALLDAVKVGTVQDTQRELAGRLKMDPSKVSRLRGRAEGNKEITKAEWEACMSGAAAGNPDF